MPKSVPITLKMYLPRMPEGRAELANRIAMVHADAAVRRIQGLNCPTSQKLALLDALIQTARSRQTKEAPTGPGIPPKPKMANR